MNSSPAVAGATVQHSGSDRGQLKSAAPYIALLLAVQISLALILVLTAG